MLSSKLGHVLDKPLAPVARHIRLTPNFLTLTGFLVSLAAALVIPQHIRAGGLLILVGGFFDMMDGIVARTNGKASIFGAFLDSLLDRFSDAFVLLSISLYFLENGDQFHALVSIVALAGAFGVSYARARAEGLGCDCTVGVMERPERIVLLAIGCLFPFFLVYTVWAVLAGSYVTVLQRISRIWNLALKSGRES